MSHVFPRHMKSTPPTAVAGEGCYIIDADGKRYLDGSGGAAVSCLGHSHPAVIEAAVFGIPSERWGETPCAHVTVNDAEAVDEQALIALCAEQLGSSKKPGRVVVATEALPKSPVGKILRKALREPYWSRHDRRTAGS